LNLDQDFTMTIGNEPVGTATSLDIVNPHTGQVFAQAPSAGADELDRAVAAARRALPAWRARPLAQRCEAVQQLANALEAQAEGFARLLTREQGKAQAEAKGELASCIRWLRETAQAAAADHELAEASVASSGVTTQRLPLGVVAAIAPWNFPLLLGVWKVAPALVTGNTMVLKPSPFTPLTSLKFGELARRILPPGVLNVISGGDALGPLVTAHPGFDKIAFTGSTVTGRAVLRSAAAHLTRVTLELGGNDPAIVMPDVDLDVVVPKLFSAAFRNAGQFCVAAKRMYVHRSIYEDFKERFVAFARSRVVGDGSDAATHVGPVQNAVQFSRLRELIDHCAEQGYTFALGGPFEPGTGYHVPLTILDNPPDDSRPVAEEAFGPVLPLLPFDSVDEVVERANATEYGLAASVWCRDPATAAAIAGRLAAGTVWVNTVHELSPQRPFAGHKQSGFGVENGRDGLHEYTSSRVIVAQAA
jgi:acyl-CoA reductase-like NAD-dependent aldehyde dehydrogenase